METILQTTNLSRQFGKKMAVNNVNMTIHKGDIYGFIGKNGAGKTTFMRLVLGTAFPSKGEVAATPKRGGSGRWLKALGTRQRLKAL